ncbi:MAG TPA: hypothetical protein VK167_05585 [Flavipsychrobacter sp.]|nr:hypothetical protein [Flavipsychrobacter sp.]
MKPAANTLLSIAFMALAFVGCKKDNDNTTPLPDAAAFNKLLNDGQNSLITTTNLKLPNIYSYYTIGMVNGTLITLPQNTLFKDGVAITSNATLEYCQFYDRKSMIIADKPNIARTSDGTYEMLANSCIFYLAAKQDGTLLTINNFIRIDVKRQTYIGTEGDTIAFNAKTSVDGTVWEPAKNWMVYLVQSYASYIMNVPDNNWYAFGRFYNDGRPLTSVTVNVPEGYANASRVYIIPKGFPRSVGTPQCKMPIGEQCYILFVTERNGQYCWTYKDVSITENHVENIDLSHIYTGNLSNFSEFIDILK